MNYKKLALIIPIALLMMQLFSKSGTPTLVKPVVTIDVPHTTFQTSDYKSPHSGKIQMHIEIYSQATESEEELKRIQQTVLTSAIPGKSVSKDRELRLQYPQLPLLPFYISYCTIMV